MLVPIDRFKKYTPCLMALLPIVAVCSVLMWTFLPLIEAYNHHEEWRASGGIPATMDAERALTVEHGYEALIAVENFHDPEHLHIDRVRVLGYTPINLIVIACGDIVPDSEATVIYTGFKNIYVFVRENSDWSLDRAYDIRDTRAFLRDMEHSGREDQEYASVIMPYFPRDHFCKF